MKKIIFVFAAAALSLLSACHKAAEPATPAIIASSIEFVCSDEDRAKFYTDATESLVFPMLKGQNTTFSYAITPSADDLTYPDVVWLSSDESVMSVDNGKITAMKEGQAVLTVRPATVNLNVFASVLVKVSDVLVPVTSISITDNATETDDETGLPKCSIGETMQLKASIAPEEATYQTAIWSSSDETVAKVDPVSGLVRGVGAGYVTIYAAALDGSEVKGEHRIYIEELVNPTGIKLNESFENMLWSPLSPAHKIDFTIEPANATKSLVKWTISDPTALNIDARGNMSFIHYGKVTVTASVPEGGAEPSEGFAKSVQFTVNIPAGYYNDHCELDWWRQDTKGSTATMKYNELTGEHYREIVPNTGSKFRADFKLYVPKWNDGYGDNNYIVLDRANYPIVTFRLDDVRDTRGATGLSIFIDTNNGYAPSSGSNARVWSGRMGGGGANKWVKKLKCSDGSSILVYNIDEQNWQNGGKLPENDIAIFNHFKIGYADIAGIASVDQSDFRYFWFHTFKSMSEFENYLVDWSSSTGITYTE